MNNALHKPATSNFNKMNLNNIERNHSYVLFDLAGEKFAIDVNGVLEILPEYSLTKVPHALPFVKGVMNFRGSVVPVIDMGLRLYDRNQSDGQPMAMIVETDGYIGKCLLGLQVDGVLDVIQFRYADIRKLPEMSLSFNSDYLLGFVEMDGNIVLVLDLQKVLNMNELAEMSGTVV